MKNITAYVNTLRVQHLMEELSALGVRELKVKDYFSPSPKISYMKLLCEDDKVEKVRSVIDRIGATGTACDHCFRVTDLIPGAPTISP